MRRTEHLIAEIRRSTDNEDRNGIKDSELIAYLNYGQKLIQNMVFAANPKADLFKKSVLYPRSASGEYELPADIFAVNAIRDVFYVQGEHEHPMDRIDPSELSSGYYTEDNKLVVKGFENFDVKVSYFRSLPKMDKRWGRISDIRSGELELESGFDESASSVDDFISVVDKFGKQVASDIYIDNFNDNVWETADDLSSVSVGNFVCMGRDTVNTSLLPDSCETYLLDYVRQRIYTRNNYEDGNKQLFFTNKQRADIESLFANNQKDGLTPPISDYEAFDYELY